VFELPRGRSRDVHRVRLRLRARGIAFAFAEATLPTHLFPDLDNDALPDGDVSLYAIYQARYGVNIIRVVEDLYAVRATATVARALGLAGGEPVLEVRRVAYTFNDAAVERRTTWIHTR
jgi:GntR family transcriptional regulator